MIYCIQNFLSLLWLFSWAVFETIICHQILLCVSTRKLFQSESNPCCVAPKLIPYSFPWKMHCKTIQKDLPLLFGFGFIKILSVVLCVSAEPTQVTFQRDLLDPRDSRKGKNSCRTNIALSFQLDMARLKMCREKKRQLQGQNMKHNEIGTLSRWLL